jgi:2-iminobutanoate/2-iminopropanoate deaminase
MIERIAPAGGPHASGAYAPAIRAGNLVFVSGQGPLDPSSGELAAEDIAGQVRRTLANVALVLEATGAGLADVVRVDAYLANIGDFAEYDQTFREVFGEQLPTRTTVEAALGGILVEINAIAYVDDASS